MKGKNVLVTGGAGYIGSHTMVELAEAGYTNIYSVDNYINSSPTSYSGVEEICGILPVSTELDLTNKELVNQYFKENKIDAVIHFAALKSVPESVENPNLYYHNNLNSLLNVLEAMKANHVSEFIFSSSCSVYGNPEQLPVTEFTPFGKSESPYARTKQMGEEIICDFAHANPDFNAISLRYFNPVGAHPSAIIGEGFSKKPDNLVPIITQSAAGLRDAITVFGKDYNTRDGSCIRDYIHVSDIAIAHVKAIDLLLSKKNKSNYQVINLGSGVGTSVFEMLETFEKVNQVKVPFVVGARREGDVESIFANNNLANMVLGWKPKYILADMLESAWRWQQKLLKN